MPNNGRITLCPYYRYERKNKIVCEDVARAFRDKEQKDKWMDQYCDDRWEDCKWAAELNKIYQEGGDMQGHVIGAMKQELHKRDTMAGRDKKRLEAKEEEIKELRKKKRVLEDKLHKAELALVNQERLEKEFMLLASLYECRFAYLIEQIGGSVSESDMESWAKGKEFAVIGEEEGGNRIWRSVVREVKDDTANSDDDTAVSDNEEEQSEDPAEVRQQEEEDGSVHSSE